MTAWPHLSDALPQLARPAAVAEFLGLATDTVSEMCLQGKLPAVKVGGRWYINLQKLAELLDGQTVPSPSSRRVTPQRAHPR